MVNTLLFGIVSCGSNKPRPAILDCPASINTQTFSRSGIFSTISSIDFGKYRVLSPVSCAIEVVLLAGLQAVRANSKSMDTKEGISLIGVVLFKLVIAVDQVILKGLKHDIKRYNATGNFRRDKLRSTLWKIMIFKVKEVTGKSLLLLYSINILDFVLFDRLTNQSLLEEWVEG